MPWKPLPTRAATFAATVLACLLVAGCSNVQLGKKEEPRKNKRPAHWKTSETETPDDGGGGVFSALIHGFGNSIDPHVDPPAYYRKAYGIVCARQRNAP